MSAKPNIILSILVGLVVSCSANTEQQSANARSDEEGLSDAQKSILDELIDKKLTDKDSSGNVTALKGFVSSDKIQEGQALKAHDVDQAGSSKAFAFEEPSGMEAEFSEPVMVTSANLYLAEKTAKQDAASKKDKDDSIEKLCQGLAYQKEEPTIAQVIEFSQKRGLCGALNFNFCIKLSFANNKKAQSYTKSPAMNFQFVCPDEAFADLGMKLSPSTEEDGEGKVDIHLNFSAYVVKMYLTNEEGCMEGGEWQKAAAEWKGWSLKPSKERDKKSAQVYAMFKDLMGNESACIAASMDPQTLASKDKGGDLAKVSAQAEGSSTALSGDTAAAASAVAAAEASTQAAASQGGGSQAQQASQEQASQEVTATLSNTPADYGTASNLDVTVAGSGVVTYRYALLDSASDCTAASYSQAVAVSTKITATIGANGNKTLCVKGLNAQGGTQTTATSYQWYHGGPQGFTKISKANSKLAYDYYIMSYEAALASGNLGADSVTATEADILRCSYEFHVSKDAFHSSCGTRSSSAIPKSEVGATPLTSVDWSQAFTLCRNMSDSHFMVRLPTREEWLRAARWSGSDYGAQWNIYTGVTNNDCNITGSVEGAGASSACKSALGVYDVAGNVSEWVDMRLARYDIAANSESRFSYGPVIGRNLDNGIDRLVRRFHAMDPTANKLALSLGARVKTPTLADRKQYGFDVQEWSNPASTSNSLGFRCVAFPKTQMPTLAELSLPAEPVYTSSDIAVGSPGSWKIPENLYVKDTKYETVAITVNGDLNDNVAEGSVTISWSPWSKAACNDATCSASTSYDNFTYHIYRYVEPTKFSIRLSTPWALSGGPYTSDLALDPLDTSNSNQPIATISNCASATPNNCTFTDSVNASTNFSPSKLYRYMLVVADGQGNTVLPMVQRYRSPYFAGSSVGATSAAFRMESRQRMAGVFLVDEAYQLAQTVPQVMSYIPMQLSGSDHDYFIYKYKAARYSGSAANDATNAKNPLGATDGTSDWIKEAAECYDTFLQSGGSDLADCGTNATSIVAKSDKNATVYASMDQGGSWRACMNTSVSDGNGNAYHLTLVSGHEWLRAADWGDTDLDGDIDRHESYPANVGANIASLEYTNGSASGTCNTGGTGHAVTGTAQREVCQSRYGVSEMVGNDAELVSERVYLGVGLDNGRDGLWLGHATKTSSFHHGTMDLLRGSLPASANDGAKMTSGLNGDYYWTGPDTLRMVYFGGGWWTGNPPGRWSSYTFEPTSYSSLSFRCTLGN